MSDVVKIKHKSSRPSICSDCARHPSLKKMIAEDSVYGHCAFCARTDAQVRCTEHAEPMVMLMRALIRYHWDEWSYNSHWGGDGVMSLFDDPNNPIVEPPVSSEDLDDFSDLLEHPAYPDWDQGVSVYAGFDENGDRGCHRAISRTEPPSLRELQVRLLAENFFEVEPALESLIDPFLEDITIELPAGGIWYRARLGHAASFQRATDGWVADIRRQPWTGVDIGAPPPPKAGVGRLNRGGVSMLYLASDAYTAIAEIRPHPGHIISIGGFECLENIRVADFNPDISLFSTSDKRLSLYTVIQALDRLMSSPVTPDERTRYLLTQLLAEVLLRRGFHGVRFRSSVASGANLCIFHPAKFKYVEGISQIKQLLGVQYEAGDVPILMEAGTDDFPLREKI